MLKTSLALIIALVILAALSAFLPSQSTEQTALWTAATVNATPQTQLVACGQGAGDIGRKTLAVWNSPNSSGTITVTGELRDATGWPNYTSGYLAVNGVTVGSGGSDTALPSEAAGRYCYFTAVATTTTVITAVLRRE